MKVEGARLQRYELPLKETWRTAAASSSRRIGHVLGLRGHNRVGWGDAAPLPGSQATEAARCARDVAQMAARAWGDRGFEPPLADVPHAAARHAWVQALMDLESQTDGQSLADALARRLGTTARRDVRVNATLPWGSETETVEAALRAKAAGYDCLKLKVAGSGKAVRTVAAVRDAVGPNVAFRLDANGSWGEQEAPALLKSLAPFDIEYVEQPFPPARLPDLVQLHRHTPIPLAADESAHHLAHALGLIERGAIDVIIVKPMALGGLDYAIQLIQAAHDRGVPAIVTDSVESAAGRTGALHLAAALPGAERVSGVASGEWFERDVVPDPPRVEAGRMAVPQTPGLGLALGLDVEGRA